MQYYVTKKVAMANLSFWGLTASPYQLKMQSLADYAGMPWQRWPDQAGMLQAITAFRRLSRARKQQSVERFPQLTPELDEYPEVPYYTFDGRQFYYDSTGLALHLDSLHASSRPLVPEKPAERFICCLIDEAFDEFGLYMVHHNRWVTSASTNTMGEMTVREMRKVIPPLFRQRNVRKLSERQVRRCPYLFSVAPTGYSCDMPEALTPPSREGFPPTHELLDTAWRRYLAAIEAVLQQQPFLLGQRFTLADASAYGQLSMNLVDGRAAELLEELAPLTFQWLCMIRDGGHKGSSGELFLSAHLGPLLDIIGETFVPLMQQNEAAYSKAVAEGQVLFNEAAFNRGEALYEGSLLGMPFRAVVKSFQVQVWRDLCQSWRALGDDDRVQLQSLYPRLTDFHEASQRSPAERAPTNEHP
jgi:glutathione S-transferase